jgi:hypothetical protein
LLRKAPVCREHVRALSHMDSSMCSSASDPKMWIIQGTLAWRTPPENLFSEFETKLLLRRIDGAIQVRSNMDPISYSLVGSGRSGGVREKWNGVYNLKLYT